MCIRDRVIGVCGAGKGTGVTHFCIMAASYLSGVPRKKTALLEWNCSKDFAAMEKICKGRISQIEFFSILDVDYYKQSCGTVLADCLEKEYEYIIIDFGVLTKDNREDFVRCRRKLVIGSCIEWRLGAFMEILTNGRKGLSLIHI